MVNLETSDDTVKVTEGSLSSPLIIETSVASEASSYSSSTPRNLRLVMLGCEENPPYGPTDHTGKLFLELIRQTLGEQCAPGDRWNVSIAIYRVQLGEFPANWDVYDGILLPGSFSAAYDTEPWIKKLKHVIQEEIVDKQRPTMGICFGHQILAHSFAEGKAKKYGPGSRGGRYAMTTTKAGSTLLNGKDSIQLYYTHGDMVEKLPPSAVALGVESDDNLPVQAAAYFKDEGEAQTFESGNDSVKPFAITFQAHPEYAVSQELGLSFTLDRILNLMAKKELLSAASHKAAQTDAAQNFDSVHQQSKDAFAASAKALGWFL